MLFIFWNIFFMSWFPLWLSMSTLVEKEKTLSYDFLIQFSLCPNCCISKMDLYHAKWQIVCFMEGLGPCTKRSFGWMCSFKLWSFSNTCTWAMCAFCDTWNDQRWAFFRCFQRMGTIREEPNHLTWVPLFILIILDLIIINSIKPHWFPLHFHGSLCFFLHIYWCTSADNTIK